MGVLGSKQSKNVQPHAINLGIRCQRDQFYDDVLKRGSVQSRKSKSNSPKF